jgi:hypothetical protein
MHRVRTFLLRAFLGLLLVAVTSIGYAFWIEPRWVEVTTVRLNLPHLPPEFAGYRIVQFSDLHADEWMTPDRLSRMVAIANRQTPDLVALTGDYVTHDPEIHAQTLLGLRELKARDGAIAVLGNHDHWTDAPTVRRALQQAGILELSNQVHLLQRQGRSLPIAGVDDVWYNQDRLDLVLEQLPNQPGAILLVHEPDFADTSAATGRFDLQLSGHSHGGQVKVPFWGQPILPPYGKKYPSGRYQIGQMVQYTNRGLGMVKPYVRFHCRPEITLFVLNPA